MEVEAYDEIKKIYWDARSTLRPLVIEQGALLLHAGGKIHHTSRVVAIHDQSDDMVRFETLNSNYCLLNGPFPLAACNPLPDGEPGRVRVKRL